MPIVTGCLCRLFSYFGKLRQFMKLFFARSSFAMGVWGGVEKIFLGFFSNSFSCFLKNIAVPRQKETAAVHAKIRQCCQETESIVK